jgi:hypothetical protein
VTTGHIDSSRSIVDILAPLFSPLADTDLNDVDRDGFVSSKGHDAFGAVWGCVSGSEQQTLPAGERRAPAVDPRRHSALLDPKRSPGASS